MVIVIVVVGIIAYLVSRSQSSSSSGDILMWQQYAMAQLQAAL